MRDFADIKMSNTEAENLAKQIDLSKAGWGMQLVETASNLFCICCDDHILYMNPAGLKLLNANSVDEVLGRPLIDFIHPDYQEFLSFGLEMLAEEDDFVPLKLKTVQDASLDVKLLINELQLNDKVGYIVEAQNITEYKRASEAVQEREHRLKSILNTVTEGILTCDKEGTVQTFNPAAEKVFGVSAQEILGKNFSVLMPEENQSAYEKFFSNQFAKANSRLLGRPLEFKARKKDSTVFPIEMTVTSLQVGSEKIFTAVFRDITERKESEERIRHMAHHDTLTGLPNRHLFTDRLHHAVKISSRYNKSLVLMFIDLDKFKPINDTLGHEAGDIVLQEVARRFKMLVRESDTVARIGGDEFVVLLEELDTPEPGPVVAQKILDALEVPILAGGRECQLGASIGLSCFPDDSKDAEELMRFADEAMYAVKTSGRNGYKLYESTLSILG